MKKYTSQQTRQTIVRLYAENRLTEKQIATIAGVAPSTVHYWITRYDYFRVPDEGEGEDGEGTATAAAGMFENMPKSGRPRKLNRDADESIFAMSAEDPFAAASDIRSRLDLADKVCVQTVRNRLRERGLRSRVPSRKDHLTDEHVRAREAFALRHLEWTADQWDEVLFTDEKLFCIGGNGSARVWRPVLRKDERCLYPQYITDTKNTEWGRETIPVWGCISSGGRDRNHIHLIDPEPDPVTKKKTLRARYYVDGILEPIVKGRVLATADADAAAAAAANGEVGGGGGGADAVVFMHDRSRIHTANLTNDWLLRNRVDALFDWPAKAPDMNPIENVWGELERKLRNRNCRNRHELWLIVSGEFEELTRHADDPTLPSPYVKNLIGSMPRRVRSVYERGGRWSEY